MPCCKSLQSGSWIAIAGFLIWSEATAATGLAHDCAILVVMRLQLGAGESLAYPCYSNMLTANFAEPQRGLANSLINTGTQFGPALGVLAGGILIESYGWRTVSIILSLGNMLWLPAWLKWMPAGHSGNEATHAQGHGPVAPLDWSKKQNALT